MQTEVMPRLATVARSAGIEYQRLWRALSGATLSDGEHEQLRRVGYALDQSEAGVVLRRLEVPDGD